MRIGYTPSFGAKLIGTIPLVNVGKDNKMVGTSHHYNTLNGTWLKPEGITMTTNNPNQFIF